jgi:hypothetical protein
MEQSSFSLLVHLFKGHTCASFALPKDGGLSGWALRPCYWLRFWRHLLESSLIYKHHEESQRKFAESFTNVILIRINTRFSHDPLYQRYLKKEEQEKKMRYKSLPFTLQSLPGQKFRNNVRPDRQPIAMILSKTARSLGL